MSKKKKSKVKEIYIDDIRINEYLKMMGYIERLMPKLGIEAYRVDSKKKFRSNMLIRIQIKGSYADVDRVSAFLDDWLYRTKSW